MVKEDWVWVCISAHSTGVFGRWMILWAFFNAVNGSTILKVDDPKVNSNSNVTFVVGDVSTAGIDRSWGCGFGRRA